MAEELTLLDPRTRIDLGSIVRRQAEIAPDSVFCERVDGEMLTYEEFDRLVGSIAAGLQQLGVGLGDFVNVMLPNGLDLLALSYGLKRLGAIEVAIDQGLRGDQLERACELASSSLTISTAELLAEFSPNSSERRGIRSIVVAGAGEPPAGVRSTPFEQVCEARPLEEMHVVDDQAPAVVLFTSGSSGPSKGCVLSHRALLRAGQSVATSLRLTSRDCVYTAYPLSHMRAAYLDVLPALLVGGRVVVAERFSASRFWTDVATHGVTVFSLIGTVMGILWESDPHPSERQHSVEQTWGGPITVDPAAFERRFGVRVLPGDGVYGMTEVGMLSMTSYDDSTSGRVRPEYEVRIASDSGDEVAPGALGEILVRPREAGLMFQGYLNQPADTVAAWSDLWFHTGDLGKLDESGRLIFVGRRKDMIRRAGTNISAWDLEDTVGSHEEVAECAAIGVPAPLGEEHVLIAVVRRSGSRLTAPDLNSFCVDRLPRNMVPNRYEFVDSLPRTPNGKIAKADLAKQFVGMSN